jgi:hypothetical protein
MTEERILFQSAEVPDKEKIIATAKKGYGIEHPEKIQGFAGTFLFTLGDVYVTHEIDNITHESPSFGDELRFCMSRLMLDDYGLISEDEEEGNLENKYMFGHSVGQYGRYNTEAGIVRLERCRGYSLFSMDTGEE